MSKRQKKVYHSFPLIKKRNNCPICNTQFVQSKLMIALYDGLNENHIEQQYKMSYCNSCHVPFITKEYIKEIESNHPGYHLEIQTVYKNVSREFLQKRIEMPPKPICNVPKGTVLFIGDRNRHMCGEDALKEYKGLIHGETHEAIDLYECTVCGKKIISSLSSKSIIQKFPEYIYMHDAKNYSDMYPNKKTLYMLNINQYTKTSCPACGSILKDMQMYFKNDKTPMMQPKNIKQCVKCNAAYGRVTSFEGKPYSMYKFSQYFYQEEKFRENGKHIVLKAGDFLTRHNLSGCQNNGHSLEDITARIRIVTKDGKEIEQDIPAVRCDTCGRLFILEKEYEKIIKIGAPLCPIVENEYWRRAADRSKEWSESEARGSILYVHGYNVNAYNNLTPNQRHSILNTLLKDEVLTKAQICSHLDMLIQRAGSQPLLQTAKKKWIDDRNFMETCNTDTDVVKVKSITHTTYHTK